jgi:hypothetical protein
LFWDLLVLVFLEAWTLYSGPRVNQKQKVGMFPPLFIYLCSKSFFLQSPCNHLGFQEGQMITSSWQGAELPITVDFTHNRPTCQFTKKSR